MHRASDRQRASAQRGGSPDQAGAASPLSGIPGVPTTLGVLVALVAGQLVLKNDKIWLPHWILARHFSREKFRHALRWMHKPARFIDRFLRPRLIALTRRRGAYIVALVCIVIGLVMPTLEIVPFSAHFAGLALAAFGLALISHDGVLGLVALLVTAGIVGFAAYTLLT